MAGGSYYKADVVCPFYRSDDGKSRISCEGLTEQSTMSMYFRRKKDFVKRIEKLCCGECIDCELYKLLLKKYE